MRGVEGLLELVGYSNTTVHVFVDVQGLEERLVQPAAPLVVTASVERLGIFEELQAGLDDLRGGAEVLVSVLRSGGDPSRLI